MTRFPAYAYIPGRNDRHPEGAFDAIRASVCSEMNEAALAETEAMQAGLIYLQNGFFWEAHEVLEPVWMACSPNSAARHAAQALIQLANAQLKLKAGQSHAARRILGAAQSHLTEVRYAGREDVLGLSVDSIWDWIGAVGDEIAGAINCINSENVEVAVNKPNLHE